jgi:hypothetical protein
MFTNLGIKLGPTVEIPLGAVVPSFQEIASYRYEDQIPLELVKSSTDVGTDAQNFDAIMASVAAYADATVQQYFNGSSNTIEYLTVVSTIFADTPSQYQTSAQVKYRVSLSILVRPF